MSDITATPEYPPIEPQQHTSDAPRVRFVGKTIANHAITASTGYYEDDRYVKVPAEEVKRGGQISAMNCDQLRHLIRTTSKGWERAYAKSLLK